MPAKGGRHNAGHDGLNIVTPQSFAPSEALTHTGGHMIHEDEGSWLLPIDFHVGVDDE
jgi:hypothetical protein